MFKKATKKKSRLRMALCGPSGSGKTYTALKMATELAQGGKIAFADTERGSASKYADLFDFDVHDEFDGYDPLRLIDMMQAAAQAGYAVFVIDSLSHFWFGKDGELDKVDKVAKRSQSGNSFTAWKEVTPIHNRLIDALLQSPMHVIVTMRTKTEWVIEENERGKKMPRKIGMAPIMRDGIEFEFDICGDMDQENTLIVTKSRCPKLAGQTFIKPGKDVATILLEWLDAGVEAPKPTMPEVGNSGASNPAPSGSNYTLPSVEFFRTAQKFEKLKIFKDAKNRLAELTQSNETYYTILGAHGAEHASEFKTVGDAVSCWKEMRAVLEMREVEKGAVNV